MAVVWKLNGQTLADLGVEGLARQITNQLDDRLTFRIPGDSFADPTFAYGATVTLTRDNVTVFTGTNRTIPRTAAAAAEGISYEIAGPWYELRRVYKQEWRVWSASTEAPAHVYQTRVILNWNGSAYLTSGAQIIAAVQYAIDKGAAVQIGTIDPGVFLNPSETRDMSVQQVIREMLRWTPDAACWFDYTTTPPTLHVRSQANLTAATIALGDYTTEEVSLVARQDLVRPGVEITFLKRVVITGSEETAGEWAYAVPSTAGDPDDPDALTLTIELRDERRTVLSETIDAEAWPTDLNSKAWWKARLPGLAAYADADITITEAARPAIVVGELPGTLPRVLITGSIQDWMEDGDGDPLQSVVELVTAKLTLSHKNGAGEVVVIKKDAKLAVRVTATDAEAKKYTSRSVDDPGEAVPTGLAASLYASWSVLHYEGAISITTDECTCAYRPGQKINLTGGRAAWAAMGAMVQQVTDVIDDGTTKIMVGPPGHLSPNEVAALMQMTRRRQCMRSDKIKETGRASDGAAAVDFTDGAKDQSGTLGGEYTRLIVSHYPSPSTIDNQIDLNPTTLLPHQVMTVEADGDRKIMRPGVLRFYE